MLGLTHIQDFYVLERMNFIAKQRYDETYSKKDEKLYEDIHEKFIKLTDALAEAFYYYVFFISMGEARHSSRSFTRDRFLEGLTDKFVDRSVVIKSAIQYDPAECADALISVFDQNWTSNGYGGPNWLTIAKALKIYGKVPNAVFVDHVVDLCHNNGTAFSKNTTAVMKFDYIFHNPHLNLREFLNWKKKTHDVWISPTAMNLTQTVLSLRERLSQAMGVDAVKLPTYPDDWTWEPPVFGSKIVKATPKLTPYRDVYAHGNQFKASELVPIVQSVLKEYITKDFAFVLHYGDGDIAKFHLDAAAEELANKLNPLLAMVAKEDPKVKSKITSTVRAFLRIEQIAQKGGASPIKLANKLMSGIVFPSV